MQNDLLTVLNDFVRKKIVEDINVLLPAQVIEYDAKNNRVAVRPLIMYTDCKGNPLQRAIIYNIPVFRNGNNNFFIQFPIKKGDCGWIKACDRDISLLKESSNPKQEFKANTRRYHSFNDSVFFPDVFSGGDIHEDNKDALNIQSVNGEVSLSLHGDKIVLNAPHILIQSNDTKIENVTEEDKERTFIWFEKDKVSIETKDLNFKVEEKINIESKEFNLKVEEAINTESKETNFKAGDKVNIESKETDIKSDIKQTGDYDVSGKVKAGGDVSSGGNVKASSNVEASGDVKGTNVKALGEVSTLTVTLNKHVHLTGNPGTPTLPPTTGS